jgi:K+-transporting ATPase ATPase C chain
MILRNLRTSCLLLLVMTLLTGAFYPLLVTAVARALFPGKADGSLVMKGGRVAGSELIGQPFDAPGYFWSRPSATAPFPYNASASTGSNLGPANPHFLEDVERRVARLASADSTATRHVPVDLVTASGSGLDPHISVASALYQVPRVARARHLPDSLVSGLVTREIEGRQFGFLGEARVNVLLLNIALDDASHRRKEQ